MKIKDININTRGDVIAFLKKVEQRESKKGPFCVLTITDGETETTATAWNVEKTRFTILLGRVINVHLFAQEFNGAKSFIAERYTYAGDQYSIRDFIKKTPKEPFEYKDEILMACRRNTTDSQQDILDIVYNIYDIYEEQLLHGAAAKMVHHNLVGGLMQHTATVVANVEALAAQYPELNKGVAVCAAALHDVGKIFELRTDQLGESVYTLSGEMLGHTMISLSIIDTAQANLGLRVNENITLLKHCVASHHGKKEWGATALPMIPEAQLLFICDVLDARMYTYNEAISQLDPGQISDKAVFGLDAKVYRAIGGDI